MICPYCKKELPEGTQFCSNCGQTISNATGDSSASLSYWSTVKKQVERDEQIRIDAESKHLQEQREKKKFVYRLLFISLTVLSIIGAINFYNNVYYPRQRYEAACELLSNGAFDEAKSIFEEIPNYKDAGEQIIKCQDNKTAFLEDLYQKAVAHYNSGNYNEALPLFEQLHFYKQSKTFAQNCRCRIVQEIAPRFHWDFSDNLLEQNGLPTIAHGKITINNVSNSKIASAAFFNGDGDYIECGQEMNLPENYTFSILFSCHDVNKEYSAFFAKFENNNGPYAFSINRGRVNLWLTQENGYHTEIESNKALYNYIWYVISIVKCGDDFSLYINGELDSEATIPNLQIGNDLVTIGRQALMFYPEDQLQFTGYIGDISIYDQALSSDEIFALYKVILKS